MTNPLAKDNYALFYRTLMVTVDVIWYAISGEFLY